MSSIQAVIFDLDGTLVDTLQDIADSMNETLDELGWPGFSIEQYRQCIGGGSAAMVTSIASRLGIENQDSLLKRYMHRYTDNLTHRSKTFDGIEQTIKTCLALEVPIAVMTNKDHTMSERLCQHLFPANPFRQVVGLSSTFPKKPSPDAALHIANTLHIEPKHCLVVGDTEVDIHTAQAAGMMSAAVLWGYGSRERLNATRPDYTFSHPEELMIFLHQKSSARSASVNMTLS